MKWRKPRAIAMLALLLYISLKLYAEYHWYEASRLAIYHDYQAARRSYEKAATLLSNNTHFLFNYGAESFIAGEYHHSIKLLEQAKQSNPHSNVYFYLAESYAGTGNYEESEKKYRMSIGIAPKFLYPKERLVELYLSQGYKAKAVELARSALAFPYRVPTNAGDGIRARLKRIVESENQAAAPHFK